MKNIVIDIGNTRTGFALYDGEKQVDKWLLSTDEKKSVDEYGITLLQLFNYKGHRLDELEGAMISSVVPTVERTIREVCQKYMLIEPLFVGPGIKTGLNILYENPKEVGADRIVNAVAAKNQFSLPVIVVDIGTATTFCYVNEKGQYGGGAIAPGLAISRDALFEKASKLPKIEIIKEKNVIARNTAGAMRAGIFYGYIGQIEGIISRMKAEIKSDVHVIATGEQAEQIASETEVIDHVDASLTFKGLQYLYLKNRILIDN